MNRNHHKAIAAERLFDAIGMIDDLLITEAEAPYTPKPRAMGRAQLRTLIAVACACAVITVGVFGGSLLSSLINGVQSDESNSAPESPDVSAPIPTAGALEQYLTNATVQGVGEIVSPEDVDFFDGTAKVIWKMAGNDGYYMLRVQSSADAKRIQAQLKQEATDLSPDEADAVGCSVWIAYGDGTVVSPYLKASAGNVGYATLFDYAPEILPGDSLTRLIREATSY